MQQTITIKTKIMKTQLKSAYYIPVHSFVDLITNSSTEIYIQATDKTIETIKKIIDNLLENTNSKLKTDDLFEFSLVNTSLEDRKKYYKNEELSENECDTIELKVKNKSDDVLIKETSELLQNLFDTLHIEASYED